MTIAIQGDWGSGKTSVMEMVRDTLRKTNAPVHCVWFNTWQFSQFNTSDSLSLALIESIVDGLDIECGETTGAIRSGFDKLRGAMLNAGKTAFIIGMEKLIGSVKTGEMNDAMKNEKENNEYKSLVATIATLKERFQQCVDIAIAAT
jgi:hypothetical protein